MKRFARVRLAVVLGLMAGGCGIAAADEPVNLPGVAEVAEVAEIRPPVIPALSLLRDPDVQVDIDALHDIKQAAFSPDGRVLWILGDFYLNLPGASEDDGPIDAAVMEGFAFERQPRVVAFDPQVLAVTRVLPGLDRAYQWSIDERCMAADEAGDVWLTGTRWKEPPRDENGRRTERPVMRAFVARFAPDGLSPAELTFEGDDGFVEAKRSAEGAGRGALRLEDQRDEKGYPTWVDHLVDGATGEVQARFIDDTPRHIFLFEEEALA